MKFPDTQALFVQTVQVHPDPCRRRRFPCAVLARIVGALGRVSALAPVAAKLVKRTPAIGACIGRAVEAWPRRLPPDELFGPAGLAAIADDRILRSLLESATIADLDFERFLTSVRFAMLQIASAAGGIIRHRIPKALHVACALARQCFVNEHVFATTDDEAAAARQLREKVIAGLASGATMSELWLAVVATYCPLGTLPGADTLLNKTWSDALAGVLTQHLREPATEAELRGAIRP